MKMYKKAIMKVSSLKAWHFLSGSNLLYEKTVACSKGFMGFTPPPSLLVQPLKNAFVIPYQAKKNSCLPCTSL